MGAKKYTAFLSYDHDDKWLADELRSALHSFARPWLARRAVRVYRDESSMATTHDLWGTIVKAIEDSEYFMLLVSPASVASNYVQQEVGVFLKGHDADKLILILARGELAWDEATGGLFLDGKGVFPEIEGKLFETAPLWEDLRWVEKEKRGEHLSLKNLRFRSVVAGISARLRGVDKDELDGRDVIEHRKRVWAFRILFAFIALSALIAGWQWYRARADARIASARAMSASAGLFLMREPNRLETSVLLAVESLLQETTADALETLTNAVELLPRQVALVKDDRALNQIAFTPDAAHLVTAGFGGVTRVWEVSSGRLVAETKHARELYNTSLSVSPDGRFILFVDNWGAVFLWDWKAPTPNIRVLVEEESRLAYFSPDGRHVVAVPDSKASAKGVVTAFYEVESARQMNAIPSLVRDDVSPDIPDCGQGAKWDEVCILGDTVRVGPPDTYGRHYEIEHEAGVNVVEFCPAEAACAGQYVATASDDGTARLWDRRPGFSRGSELARMSHGGLVRVLAFSRDGKLIATGSEDGTAKVWDYSRAPGLADSAYIEDSVRSISFTPSDDRLLLVEEKGTDLHLSAWEVASGKVTREPVEVAGHRVNTHHGNDQRTELSNGGRYLATYSPDDDTGVKIKIVVVETNTRQEVARLEPPGEVTDVSFSPDGSRLAAVVMPFAVVSPGPGGLTTSHRSGSQRVLIWEAEGGKQVEEVEGFNGEHVALSPKGLRVAGFSNDRATVWTLNSDEPPWEIKEDDGIIAALAFSPGGEHLAVCTGTRVKVYDVKRRKVVSTAVHRRKVLEATFNADGLPAGDFRRRPERARLGRSERPGSLARLCTGSAGKSRLLLWYTAQTRVQPRRRIPRRHARIPDLTRACLALAQGRLDRGGWSHSHT